VIAVDATDEIRQKRGLSRGRADDSGNLKSIQERDERETRWGLRKVITSADIIIKNNNGLDEFQAEIKDVLKKILRKR
jgi:dephospho-CoA kinase